MDIMKYKDYTWPSNPKRLEVSHRRNVCETGLVSGASIVQDLGTFCRVVRGEGELCGPACLPQWERLVQIFQEGEPGVLTLPGHPSLYHISIDSLMARNRDISRPDRLPPGKRVKLS